MTCGTPQRPKCSSGAFIREWSLTSWGTATRPLRCGYSATSHPRCTGKQQRQWNRYSTMVDKCPCDLYAACQVNYDSPRGVRTKPTDFSSGGSSDDTVP